MSEQHHDSRTAPFSPPHEPGEREDYRSFGALVLTMFQGAFSDNVFKFILIMLFIAIARDQVQLAEPNLIEADIDAKSNALAATYSMILNAAFVVPYILCVSVAGWLADRFSKSRVTMWTKGLEVVIMSLATLTFYLGEVWLSVGVLFLMSVQSTLFSPSKYGVLPELLPGHRLGWANGVLQGFTFLAILTGTIVGPILFDHFADTLWIPGLMLVGLACVGLVSSSFMAKLPEASPKEKFRINPLGMVLHYGKDIVGDTGLKWGVIGLACWWMVAIMVQSAAVLIATTTLNLDATQAGLAMVPLVIGIGAGCVFAGYISRNRIELGLVPLGAFGMFFACLWVWWLTVDQTANYNPDRNSHQYLLPAAMGLVGLMSGLFVVPLEAFVVHTSDPTERGGIWATTNVFTAFGMILGGALNVFLMSERLGGNPGTVFLAAGILMVVACVVISIRFPTIPLRLMILTLFRMFYRTRVRGVENVPHHGGALLAANHQSYLDGILLTAVVDRPIRFIMSQQVYKLWFVYPFAKLTRSIPIENTQSPRDLIHALRAASEEIKDGGLVCIFPEGQLTRIGQMLPFRRGLERIMKDLHAPVIPIAIDGAWDTAMALRGNRINLPQPLRFRRPVINVAVGEPMDSNTTAPQLRQAVASLSAVAYDFRRDDYEPLHRMGMKQLRRNARAKWYSDHSTDLIRNSKALASIIVLGKKLQPTWQGQEFVGIMLPPSIAVVCVNMAALLGGRIPVNLNYTASKKILEGICNQANIKVVITSRVFLEKAPTDLPDGLTVVFLEDVRKEITGGDKISGLLRGRFQPLDSLERYLGRTEKAKIDDLVTLIFSSGSTGTPKGVMLSHWNVYSNCQATLQYVNCPPHARLLGILPFFHSFGFLGCFWLPMLKGRGVSFFPSPIEARAIGAIVEKYKVTIMFGTPTFLNGFTRRVEPGQFGSLEFVLTGAEKLQERIAVGFEERFGIRPVEGFGCTECSPVVALNGNDWREPGIFQAGTRKGTVGRPISGVRVRIVDIDSGEDLPAGEAGMLLVSGPNVMRGYYNMPEKTKEALTDGWYNTGDVARVDEDGFLMITDRLARFSKIGGEMVPHVRIEEALHEIGDYQEQVFAVTSVPDEKKGERLVVLYTIPEADAKQTAELLQKSSELDLPALWLPKWADFIPIETIPILGSGKLDLKQVKGVAMEKFGPKELAGS